MSGFIITMMMHLFKRLPKDVFVFIFFQKIYIFRYAGQPRNSCNYCYRGNFLKITVRKVDRWRKESEEKVSVSEVKTSESHEEGDSRFPNENPKGEVPSAKKKCFSWGTVKKASVILHNFSPTHTLSHFFLFLFFSLFCKNVWPCVQLLTGLLSILWWEFVFHFVSYFHSDWLDFRTSVTVKRK